MKLNKKFYQELLKRHDIKPNYLLNTLQAFFFGGLICVIGQGLIALFEHWNFTTKDASTIMLAIMISIAILLSGLGIYDKIGQVAKAGTVIPITGFANSMSSSAMEYKPEGFVLGVGANVFKLAGSVIVYAVFFGALVALIKYGWMMLL